MLSALSAPTTNASSSGPLVPLNKSMHSWLRPNPKMEPKQHDDPAFNLWTFLIETEAILRDLDISHVPECVWQAYYDRGMAPPDALKAALS